MALGGAAPSLRQTRQLWIRIDTVFAKTRRQNGAEAHCENLNPIAQSDIEDFNVVWAALCLGYFTKR